jgi:hypothetical protein
MTGPGPLKGGLKPPRTTTQPTPGWGEKTGIAAGAGEAEETAEAQKRPKVKDSERGRDNGNLLVGSVRDWRPDRNLGE